MTLLLPLAGPARADLIDFEDLVVGTVYRHGDVFTSKGVDITVDTFFFLFGGSTNSGLARVEAFGFAGGSGNEMRTNNGNLRFDFGRDLTNLSLLFTDQGGNENLEVNGELANVGNLDALPASLGGVAITVDSSPTFGAVTGRLTLEGTIHSFAIGGQEFYIDEVEFPPIVTNQPPDCSGALPSFSRSLEPNHKWVPVTIGGVVDPDGDPLSITVACVTQDEDVVGRRGSGSTCPDASFSGSDVSLRAERDGGGDGRVYHIIFTADDGRGGTCCGQATACVPHDQGHPTCGDQGPRCDSTSCGACAAPPTECTCPGP